MKVAMDQAHDIVVLTFTFEEAQELFMRCLRSNEEDNGASREALKKLALALKDGCEFIPLAA